MKRLVIAAIPALGSSLAGSVTEAPVPAPGTGEITFDRDALLRSTAAYSKLETARNLAKSDLAGFRKRSNQGQGQGHGHGHGGSSEEAEDRHPPPRCLTTASNWFVGAPTHVDIFDYKPKLAAMHGRPVPPAFPYLLGRATTGTEFGGDWCTLGFQTDRSTRTGANSPLCRTAPMSRRPPLPRP